MLHQVIPQYEGVQPFLYACYCAEDEALAFPVLARMYNEGFRLWTSRAGGGAFEFRSAHRMSSASCVVIFHSQNMLERLRRGDAEVASTLKSSMLRVVIMLDDNRPDNRMFALSAPDTIEYKPGNDAGFWLYIYSSDCMEKCRGPWPEKKLRLRDAVYEDFSDEVIKDEYDSLANLMENIDQRGTRQDVAAPRFENNEHYIQPAKDDNVYIPLEKVGAAQTVHDKAFDEVFRMIDQCVDSAQQRAELAKEKASRPVPTPAAVPMSAKRVEIEPKMPDAFKEESVPMQEVALPASEKTAEAPAEQEEIAASQQTGAPKADFIFTPEARQYNIADYFPDGNYPPSHTARGGADKYKDAPITMTATAAVPASEEKALSQSEALTEGYAHTVVIIPPKADTAEQEITRTADTDGTEEKAQAQVISSAPESSPAVSDSPSSEDKSSSDAAIVLTEDESKKAANLLTVPVLVRRQTAQSAVKVTPTKKHALAATIQRFVRSEISRAAPSREQTVSVAASPTVTAAPTSPDVTVSAAIGGSARKFSNKLVSEPMVEPAAPSADQQTVMSGSAISCADGETKARKSRFPHNESSLLKFLSELRRKSLQNDVDINTPSAIGGDISAEAAQTSDIDVSAEAIAPEQENELCISLNGIESAEDAGKASADAEDKAEGEEISVKVASSMLRVAVNRFVERHGKNRAISVIPRLISSQDRQQM